VLFGLATGLAAAGCTGTGDADDATAQFSFPDILEQPVVAEPYNLAAGLAPGVTADKGYSGAGEGATVVSLYDSGTPGIGVARMLLIVGEERSEFLRGFDVKTGEILWDLDLLALDAAGSSPLSGTFGAEDSLTAWSGSSLDPEEARHRVFLLDGANGTVRSDGYVSTTWLTAYAGGYLVSSDHSHVMVFAGSDPGTLLWEREASYSAGSLLIGDRWVLTRDGYANLADGSLAAFGADTGDHVAYFEGTDGTVWRALKEADDYQVTLWDTENNTSVWPEPVLWQACRSPEITADLEEWPNAGLIVGDVAFVPAASGLEARDARTGKVTWTVTWGPFDGAAGDCTIERNVSIETVAGRFVMVRSTSLSGDTVFRRAVSLDTHEVVRTTSLYGGDVNYGPHTMYVMAAYVADGPYLTAYDTDSADLEELWEVAVTSETSDGESRWITAVAGAFLLRQGSKGQVSYIGPPV
jgi:hypothetical protein